jgi:hypothetical protein
MDPPPPPPRRLITMAHPQRLLLLLIAATTAMTKARTAAAVAARTAEMVDLSAAVIRLSSGPASQDPRAQVYAQMLSDEVYKRTSLRWPVLPERHSSSGGGGGGNGDGGRGVVVVQLASMSPAPVDWSSTRREGYTLSTTSSAVSVVGQDSRGLLYGVGRLLREMNLTLVQNYYTPRRVTASIAAGLLVASVPDRAMRGVQIGYRYYLRL